MDHKMARFSNPIYVARPILPNLESLYKKLEIVWRSGFLTNYGFQHNTLEKRLSDILKISHVSLFNNGTTALLIACKALKLSGEVITTPFTFPATPHSLTWNRIDPVFCDIDPISMNINVDRIESLITSRTTGILAVHTFGIPCDVIGIQKIADKHGLRVVYDAAHAFGVEINSIGIGNYGDLSMMSFHATKIFHTAEGGGLLCRDRNLKECVDLLRNFGLKNEYEFYGAGINGKMNELQAVLGLAVLDFIDDEKKKRKELIDIYKSHLQDINGISFQQEQPGILYNYSCFVIQIDEEIFGKSRDYVFDMYKKYNVYTRKYYFPLCSEYHHYSHLQSSNYKNLPIANEVVNRVLSLPLYGGLSGDDVGRICDILLEIKKS
jgi:dTDP-4-amino-4,6-dideoxygalactose transaminase